MAAAPSLVTKPCWAFQDPEPMTPSPSNRRTPRLRDEYQGWDFLKAREAQDIIDPPIRTGRKQSPRSYACAAYNILAPTAPAEHSESIPFKTSNITELASPVKPQGVKRVPHPPVSIKTTEQLSNGRWCDEESSRENGHDQRTKPVLITDGGSKRRVHGPASIQESMQDKIRAERGKDYYQIISVAELAHESPQRGARLNPHPPESNIDIITHANHNAPIHPGDLEKELADSPDLMPPEMRPNIEMKYKGAHKRRDETIGTTKQREITEKRKEDAQQHRLKNAKEASQKRNEKVSDIIRLGSDSIPETLKPSKKFFEVRNNSETTQDDSRIFGPHMRRITPPPRPETWDDLNDRKGVRLIDQSNEQQRHRSPHRALHRPSTSLGRTQGAGGNEIQKWNTTSIYAASGVTSMMQSREATKSK